MLYFNIGQCLSLIHTNVIFFEMLVVYVIVLAFGVLEMKLIPDSICSNAIECSVYSLAVTLIINSIAKLVFPS